MEKENKSFIDWVCQSKEPLYVDMITGIARNEKGEIVGYSKPKDGIDELIEKCKALEQRVQSLEKDRTNGTEK